MKDWVLNILLCLFFHFSFGQYDVQVLRAERSRNISDYEIILSKLDSSSIEYKFYNWNLELLKSGVSDKLSHQSLLKSKPKNYIDSLFIKIHKSDFAYQTNNQSQAFSILDRALLQAQVNSDSLLACRILYRLLTIIGRNPKLKKLSSEYVNKYYSWAPDKFEMTNATYFDFSFNYRVSEQKFNSKKTALNLAESLDSKFPLMELNQRIGIVYDVYLKKPDSAIIFYQRAIDIINKFENFDFVKQRKKGLLNNIGCVFFDSKEYALSLEYFNSALKIKSSKKRLVNDSIIVDWKIKTHEALQEMDSALFYSKLKDEISRNLAQEKYAVEIQKQKRKYNNEKLRADNLEIEKRRITNRNWLIAAGIVLLFGTGITVLLQKNTTKKRKLAEQEAMLKQQKVETLLKEQELVSIDAMIAGQEKERTKVANELHDDLGSLMATVKLHFDNVKVDQKDPAMKNAQDLLEKAYQKIRGMAHAKNSGVMANQGLLPAVKKMANTINKTNALKVTVEDFGLADRMENSLELTIFRIIQELVANIIKHAGATTATIQFTQHEDNMNIIVEDNGKGFDMSVAKRNSAGMGLGTIEKRIEHLEGSFTVDSVVGKGTSILIDIPI